MVSVTHLLPGFVTPIDPWVQYLCAVKEMTSDPLAGIQTSQLQVTLELVAFAPQMAFCIRDAAFGCALVILPEKSKST